MSTKDITTDKHYLMVEAVYNPEAAKQLDFNINIFSFS